MQFLCKYTAFITEVLSTATCFVYTSKVCYIGK
jgi:hypothetical protein